MTRSVDKPAISVEALRLDLGQNPDVHLDQDPHVDDPGLYRDTLHHPGKEIDFN